MPKLSQSPCSPMASLKLCRHRFQPWVGLDFRLSVRREQNYSLSLSSLPLLVPPKVQPFSFGEEPLEDGDAASIQCLVMNGDLPLNISWLFNGVPIALEDISIAQNSKRVSALTIESAKHHHAGNYSCVASNIAASSLYSAVLLVNGRHNIIIDCTLSFAF